MKTFVVLSVIKIFNTENHRKYTEEHGEFINVIAGTKPAKNRGYRQ
jgi:hypothetical protein